MGNSLHNKIYLGRRSVALLQNRRLQAFLCIAAFASIGLAWLAIRALS
ncbi:hypothetical protein HSX11_01015 [Oxalobacteraceae bacterium]|nr:hypothetical protein [Oxalobacteraceae bacterium]